MVYGLKKQKMRKKIVAGNWKMNMDYEEGLSLFSEVINMVRDEITGKQQVVVCSPFIHLHSLAQLAKGYDKVSVGAQNAHQAESGAYTGETSAKMIRSTGAEYVILGHSERRQYFGETNELLAKKVDTALKNSLKPIFCIGETLQEREANQHFDVIKAQLEEGIYHLDATQFGQLVLAYEPVWAIGTGVTATSAQAQEIHVFIRKEIAAKYNQEVADNTTILYGGSCNPKNAAELFAQADIDGGLIGGASLKSRDFVDIAKTFN
jgi:triosephosphate isomerase